MKIVYFFLFVASCVGIEARSLKSPGTLSVAINNQPPSLDITFKKVENIDDKDPVVSYKVKVVQVQKVKRFINQFDEKTKKSKMIEIEEYPKIDAYVVPGGNFTEIKALQSENPKATFYDVVTEEAYEITVFAFTKNQEGPISSPLRVRVHSS